MIHAGAHLGEEASAYTDAGVTRVLWVEGNPDIMEQLRAITEPYGHQVSQALLGAESGREVEFHVTNFDSMSSSVLRFGTHTEQHPEVIVVGQQKLRLRTLDDVTEEAGFLDADFLNIDLQGYELECLKGAERVLEKVRTIYTEVNVDELYEECVLLPELDAWLNAHGFEARIARLYGSARRRPSPAGERFFGWGDCCYVKVPSPRPFAELFPDDAADWYRDPPVAAAGRSALRRWATRVVRRLTSAS